MAIGPIPFSRFRTGWGAVVLGISFSCTRIDEDVFLSQKWAVERIQIEGRVQILQQTSNGDERVVLDSPLDSVHNFEGVEVIADFMENGEYRLAAFPAAILDFMVADTLGNWVLDGNVLELQGQITGRSSRFEFTEYSRTHATMVRSSQSEKILSASGYREIREEKISVDIVSFGPK